MRGGTTEFGRHETSAVLDVSSSFLNCCFGEVNLEAGKDHAAYVRGGKMEGDGWMEEMPHRRRVFNAAKWKWKGSSAACAERQ